MIDEQYSTTRSNDKTFFLTFESELQMFDKQFSIAWARPYVGRLSVHAIKLKLRELKDSRNELVSSLEIVKWL